MNLTFVEADINLALTIQFSTFKKNLRLLYRNQTYRNEPDSLVPHILTLAMKENEKIICFNDYPDIYRIFLH
jgi:hypothetical protein